MLKIFKDWKQNKYIFQNDRLIIIKIQKEFDWTKLIEVRIDIRIKLTPNIIALRYYIKERQKIKRNRTTTTTKKQIK